MGSKIELNDTLQLTAEQGFPAVLNLEQHKLKPVTAKDFEGQIFSFANKNDIRVYQQPPVRNFLVENKNGKWIYWGLVHILEITHNYQDQTTSGKFKIVDIFTPEQMKQAFNIADQRRDFYAGD